MNEEKYFLLEKKTMTEPGEGDFDTYRCIGAYKTEEELEGGILNYSDGAVSRLTIAKAVDFEMKLTVEDTG